MRHVLVKEPGADVPTPWHQDQPYYCVDGTDTVSLWIPLDSVPRERTLEFVAGSHKSGKYYRPERFNKTALNENDGLEPVPDIDNNRDKFNVLGWALEPGDAVAFNYLTLHGAPANKSKVDQRRAFSLRLIRLGGLASLAGSGVALGFVFFFFNQLCEALGKAEVVAPFAAAWTPPLMAMLCGFTLLCYTEDG
mgnify:CR=1 FL=1